MGKKSKWRRKFKKIKLKFINHLYIYFKTYFTYFFIICIKKSIIYKHIIFNYIKYDFFSCVGSLFSLLRLATNAKK